jgi:hypothetical protein
MGAKMHFNKKIEIPKIDDKTLAKYKNRSVIENLNATVQSYPIGTQNLGLSNQILLLKDF